MVLTMCKTILDASKNVSNPAYFSKIKHKKHKHGLFTFAGWTRFGNFHAISLLPMIALRMHDKT